MNKRLPIFEYIESKGKYELLINNPIIDFMLKFDNEMDIYHICFIIEDYFQSPINDYDIKKRTFVNKKKIIRIINNIIENKDYFINCNIYKEILNILHLMINILDFQYFKQELLILNIKYLKILIDCYFINQFKKININSPLFKIFIINMKKNFKLFMEKKKLFTLFYFRKIQNYTTFLLS